MVKVTNLIFPLFHVCFSPTVCFKPVVICVTVVFHTVSINMLAECFFRKRKQIFTKSTQKVIYYFTKVILLQLPFTRKK